MSTLFLVALTLFGETQTDWTLGPNQPGPVGNWGEQFAYSESINYKIPDIIELLAPQSDTAHWTRQVIDRGAGINGYCGIYPADFDRDGDLDLAGWVAGDRRVRLYCNLLTETGKDSFVFQTELNETCGTSATGERCLLWCGFLSNETLPDIVVPGDTVGWFENRGSFNFIWHRIGAGGYARPCCDCGDVDRDGDVDLVCGDQPLDFWRNNGDMTFTKYRVGSGRRWRVKLGDVTNDGKLDFINSDELFVFDPQSPTFFDSSWSAGSSSADGNWICDFNGDGKRDLLICDELDPPGIYWYRNNDASGRDFTRRIVKRQGHPEYYTDGCIGASVDGDSLADVIGVKKRVGYFHNPGGPGEFDEVAVDTDLVNAHWVFADRLAGLANLDIVAADGFPGDTGRFIWWKNNIKNRFYPWGQLTSSVLDGGDSAVWLTLGWRAERPRSTKLGFLVRAGNSYDQNGVVALWSDTIWAAVSESLHTEYASVPLPDWGRYFQYRVWMAGSGDTLTPFVDWVSVNHETNVPDVGVTNILWPTGSIDSGTIAVPRASVHNYYADAMSQIPVRLRIWDQFGNVTYADTIEIASLSGNGDTVITFNRTWSAHPRGPYTVKCSTAKDGDLRPGNNARTGGGLVVVRDVGAIRILSPTNTVAQGESVAPQATIHNYGNVPEDFWTLFRVENNYAESAAVSGLSDGHDTTIFFRFWTPADTGMYATCCSTMLRNDMYPANNKVTSSVTVAPRMVDIGVVRIDSPVGSVICSSQVRPRVTFKNFGNAYRPVPAFFRILDSTGAVACTTSCTFPVLAPGATRSDSFFGLRWWAWPLGRCAVSCSTTLGDDMLPDNNKVTDTIAVARPVDLAVTDILSPVGPLDSGSVLPSPVAVIRNKGLFPAVGSWVWFKVRSQTPPGSVVFYRDSVQIALLPPFRSDTITFDSSIVAGPRGPCAMKCSTAQVGDDSTANDTMTRLDSVMVHDVAVDSILCPPPGNDSVAFVNVTYSPQALVGNPGTRAAAPFDVTLQISGYSRTKQVTLAPRATQPVRFDNWTPAAPDTDTVVCNTSWLSDRNPLNDTVRRRVMILVRTLTIWPDDSAAVFPCSTHVYRMTVKDSSSVADIPDIIMTHTRPDWRFVLSDTSGNRLPDENHNNVPDLGTILPGDSASFLLTVTVPLGETAFKTDNTIVTAQSSNIPSVHHEVLLKTVTRLLAGLLAQPQDNVASIRSGATASHQTTVYNLGNYPDTFCLISEQNPSHQNQGWQVWFKDYCGTYLLPDQNGDGYPDVGPTDINGITGFLFEIHAPESAPPGEVDTSYVLVTSCNDSSVKARVRAITTARGAVLSLTLQRTQTDRCYPGEMRNYLFNVLTAGNVNDTADLTFAGNREGWEQGLFNQTGLSPLPDPGGNGVYRLGPVIPGTPDVFVLKMRAPENIADNLAGDPESLTTCTVIVNARSEFDYTLAGTCTLTVQVVPRLAIHNYENPFHDRTQFIFSVSRDCNVRLYVYNQAGEIVARLIDNEHFQFGIHRLNWDGSKTNNGGRRLPPGVYLYSLELDAPNKSDAPDRVVKKLLIK